jgi:hypothetical protein
MNSKSTYQRKRTLPLLFIFLLAACRTDVTEPPIHPPDLLEITIQQGIAGRVWFWEGNFMPPAAGSITPALRDVLIYTLTSLDSVDQVGYSPFYRNIFTSLVAETVSNDSGFFQISLEKGQYSVFVREDTLYYSNLFDGHRNIYPVTVEVDSVTYIDFDITYKASF